MADLSDFYALDELLNDDEQMIRDTVKKFVESEFKPLVAEHFEAGTNTCSFNILVVCYG